MTTQVDYPHIERPTDEPARLQRLPRVRIAQIVMGYLAHGWSAEESCRQYPHLTPAEIHSAMAYYFDHQSEIDAEIRSEVEEVEQAEQSMSRSPFYARLKAKGLL